MFVRHIHLPKELYPGFPFNGGGSFRDPVNFPTIRPVRIDGLKNGVKCL